MSPVAMRPGHKTSVTDSASGARMNWRWPIASCNRVKDSRTLHCRYYQLVTALLFYNFTEEASIVTKIMVPYS